jgi:hypothetical protein
VRLAQTSGSTTGGYSSNKLAIYCSTQATGISRPLFKHCVAVLDAATMEVLWAHPYVLQDKEQQKQGSAACTIRVASLAWSADDGLLLCGTHDGFVVLDAAGELDMLKQFILACCLCLLLMLMTVWVAGCRSLYVALCISCHVIHSILFTAHAADIYGLLHAWH